MSNNDSFVPLPEPTVPQQPTALPDDPGGLTAGPPEEGSATDAATAAEDLTSAGDALPGLAGGGMAGRRRRPARGKRLVLPQEKPLALTPQQRLLLLDTWQRSGLPASDFAALVGLSKHTLYAWKRCFDQEGPGGLLDKPKGGRPGSHLPDLTKRTILLLKQSHPDWGCQKISDLLLGGPAPGTGAADAARLVPDQPRQLLAGPGIGAAARALGARVRPGGGELPARS
jgi:hypothetical protein